MSDLLVELMDTSRFAASGAASDLVSRAAEAIAEINMRRPLSDRVIARLQTDILYDRVHSSAVTEGNRLSRRETIVVLTTGLLEAGSRKDHLEVRNLAGAMVALEDVLRNREPMTPGLFRTLHSLLLADLDPEQAGQFRTENVAISGAKVLPPHFHDVPELVRELLGAPAFYAGDLNPMQLAAWAHWAVARVHPFKDGNGRMARLVQDYLLLRSHYVPAPLNAEDREGGYYAALEASDLGNGKALLELVAKNTIRTADKYLSIIRDEDANVNWIANVTKAATEKVRDTEHRIFLGVQRASNILKSEFAAIVDSLHIPGLGVRLRDFGSLTIDQFHEIVVKGRAKRTWLFAVDFWIDESRLSYMIWYGSHHSTAFDIAAQLPSKVVLLLSAEEEDRYYHLLDELGEDRVTLRELVPDQTSFWRRRYNPVTERQEWDQDLTAGQVAREFFQEVLAKLGLI